MNIRRLKPCLIIFMGLPLSGKSTLAEAVSKQSNFVVCDLDITRIKKFGVIKAISNEKEFAILNNSYIANQKLAMDYLQENYPVIIAATYALSFSQKLLDDLVRTIQVPVKVFILQNPSSEIEMRMKERVEKGSISAVRSIDKFNELQRHSNALSGLTSTVIDTNKPLQENVNEILDALSTFAIVI